MVRSFCRSGNHEALKCGVHASAGFLVGLCAAYNITAWFFRRDHHLWVNAIVYSAAVAWEVKQTLHHLNACEQAPPLADGEKAAA
jgi:hypothetical protein